MKDGHVRAVKEAVCHPIDEATGDTYVHRCTHIFVTQDQIDYPICRPTLHGGGIHVTGTCVETGRRSNAIYGRNW